MFVLFDDSRSLYFVQLGLGIFWECTHEVARAKRFVKRSHAVKVLQANGKHRQGWRVIKCS